VVGGRGKKSGGRSSAHRFFVKRGRKRNKRRKGPSARRCPGCAGEGKEEKKKRTRLQEKKRERRDGVDKPQKCEPPPRQWFLRGGKGGEVHGKKNATVNATELWSKRRNAPRSGKNKIKRGKGRDGANRKK